MFNIKEFQIIFPLEKQRKKSIKKDSKRIEYFSVYIFKVKKTLYIHQLKVFALREINNFRYPNPTFPIKTHTHNK